MAQDERPKVKSECLRLLASLKLDPARSKLIGGFIESYLNLSAREIKRYDTEVATWGVEEREATMELVSSWEKKGIELGRQEGKEEIIALQLEQRFCALPPDITVRLDRLTSDQLNDLGRSIFQFTSLADLATWLSEH